ncbi:MAG: hypothetical protein P8Y63_12295, partial [Deltaproteobacteria bacterium]
YHFYKPYLETRFKENFIIESERKVIRNCKRGELMQLYRDDHLIAGSLLRKFGDRLVPVLVGVADNINREIYKGIFAALYYYTILYAYNNGFTEIDFLGSRPILDDGLFRYKRKWGTEIRPSPIPRGDILIKPLRFNEPMLGFFSHNHFIVREGNRLLSKVLRYKNPLSLQEIKRIQEYYFTEGLDHIKVFSMMGFDEKSQGWAENNFPKIKLVDLRFTSLPHENFCREK